MKPFPTMTIRLITYDKRAVLEDIYTVTIYAASDTEKEHPVVITMGDDGAIELRANEALSVTPVDATGIDVRQEREP